MPYIITTGLQTTDSGTTTSDGHAVGDLSEARSHVLTELGDRGAIGGPKDALCGDVLDLTESGGTIGPTRSGLVIDITPTTYADLRGPAGLEGVQLYGLRDERRAQILDAYNAATGAA